MCIVGRKSHHFISVQRWYSVSSWNLIISCTQKFSAYITKLSYRIDKQTWYKDASCIPHVMVLVPYHFLRLPWSNYEYAPRRLPWNMTILFTFKIFRLSCPKSGWNLLIILFCWCISNAWSLHRNTFLLDFTTFGCLIIFDFSSLMEWNELKICGAATKW